MRCSNLFRAIPISITLLISWSAASYALPLYERIGPDVDKLPDAVESSERIRLNRRALMEPSFTVEINNTELTAVRTRIEKQQKGTLVWVGHLAGSPEDTVIVTAKGSAFSGVIHQGSEIYQIGGDVRGNRLMKLAPELLPPDDEDGLPDGGGVLETSSSEEAVVTLGEAVVQDLLVVYTQGACAYAGSCTQLEADIATAVADINTAYQSSGINVSMNLVGTTQTNYSEQNLSQALSDLRGTSDGFMDEIHAVRDSLGADIVAMVHDGSGCGIGYLNASASTAFSVTDISCLIGNRTMAHEIGHNQGSNHDRVTAGGGASVAYNYGYRRCNDGSVDDKGSPYYRTIMSYPCTSAARIGRFSNPEINYSGVPMGIDHTIDPDHGAWAARTINESASYMANFRQALEINPPAAPSSLSAQTLDAYSIALSWADEASNEDSYRVQRSLDGSNWSTIAVLAAGATSFSDSGLNPSTLYRYRVRAENSAGVSGFSNTASATTDTPPEFVEYSAFGESNAQGLVSGSYANTANDDGIVEVISEVSSGGPKRSRYQTLLHTWNYSIASSSNTVVSINAWVNGSEGMQFFYSVNQGASWQPMFTISSSDTTNTALFVVPVSVNGDFRIQVRDAESSSGEGVDRLSIDSLIVTAYNGVQATPLAPSNLLVTGVSSTEASLSFADNADNEWGFEVRRGTSDPVGCDGGAVAASLSAGDGAIAFTDSGLTPATNYWYWVIAFNGGGSDGCSNAVLVQTEPGSLISASAQGYKVKGQQVVDLSWSGATGASVDILRNGSVINTVSNSGSYTDQTGVKGSASYRYQVCESGSSNCSDEINVIF